MRDKSEIKTAKNLGGQLTKGSGAVNDDADIRFNDCLIEMKRRDTVNDIIFYKRVWKKLNKQAVKASKMPVYIFQRKNTNYIISYADNWMYECSKNSISYITESISTCTGNLNSHFAVDEFWVMIERYQENGRVVILTFQDRISSALTFGIITYEDFKKVMRG